MMPFTPMNENIERVVENIEVGAPEEGAPAAQGGIGADTPDLGETAAALKKEGAMDESSAEETKP